MADDRRLVHRSLSDREILLLLADRIETALPAIAKKQEEQDQDIKSLLKFRWATGGALLVIGTLFGIRIH